MLKMKEIVVVAFTFIFIRVDHVIGVSGNVDIGCYVKDAELIHWDENLMFKLTFFETEIDPISFQVSFVGHEKFMDNDLLILKPRCGTIQQKRDGRPVTKNITLKNNIPVGWNSMTINLHDNKIEIGNFYNLSGFKYKVFDIQISANNLTICKKGSPTWKISNSTGVVIPLIGSSKAGISLISLGKPFHPQLTLNNIEIPLSYDEEIVVRKPASPFPPGEYLILITNVNNTISIHTKSKKNELKFLWKANIKEEMESLKVTTLQDEFKIVLYPFYEYDVETENKQSMESVYTCNVQCSNTWKIIAGVAIGGVAILTIIILGYYRPRCMPQQMKKLAIEGGEESVSLLDQESIKRYIKSKYTEPHGESNIQIGHHYKEVLKIKLETDKKIDNKKFIDKLDNKKEKKTILVVGQTGSGKSSFINAMINNIYRVKYEDGFRFKLIDDMDNSNDSGCNNTNEILSYFIPFMTGIQHNCNYIFIDTPGIGDARGIDEDKKLNQKFYEFFNKNADIKEISGICFVIKASDTRLTKIKEYIVGGLFSMFGEDVTKNLFVVVSYSDGSYTHVPELLKESGLDYTASFKFNSNGLNNDIKVEKDAQKVLKYWDMNMQSIDFFFKEIMKKDAVSLSLTNVVLEENKDINRLKDELLELMACENYATDQEKQEIHSRIEQSQKLLMIKLDEAQKLSGRLENIPAKKNPLVINEYIDMLIKNEQNKDKTLELNKLKERNTAFQKLIKDRKSPESIVDYVLGEKIKKTE